MYLYYCSLKMSLYFSHTSPFAFDADFNVCLVVAGNEIKVTSILSLKNIVFFFYLQVGCCTNYTYDF